MFLIEKIIFLAHIFPHLLTSPEKCNPKESNRTYNLICHRGNCCCCSVNKVKVKNIQSCPTLCIPMDYTVHGILQAKILEWVAIPFSWGSFQPRNWTQVSAFQEDSLPAEPPGKPKHTLSQCHFLHGPILNHSHILNAYVSLPQVN